MTENEFFGRMNDPDASSFIKGICGEEIEFYLIIRNQIIQDIKYFTEGCTDIVCSGRAVCRRSSGKSIADALMISPGEIIRSGECDFEDSRHCAILAVTAFYRAIAEYMLKP